MAGSGTPTPNSVLSKLGLKPITKCNLVRFYVPAIGACSYTALSINVMNPRLVIRSFPKTDITNYLLGTAVIGTGAYFYTREHMKAAPQTLRIVYSATGSMLLSFGSILVWAVLRSIVPPNPTVCTLVGIGSGLAFIKLTSSYLDFVDEQITKK